MAVDTREKLQSLLRDFDSAMLVTRRVDGTLRSRPMAVAEVEDGGDLWFITEKSSGKMEELAGDSHVNVSMQSRNKFVSISGTATVHDDRGKVSELWSESWKVWFPGGKDDPNLVLLHVHATDGEYWDNSGAQGIKYLLKAGRAYLAGDRPNEDDPNINSKVAL
jgi:general stress protein 26